MVINFTNDKYNTPTYIYICLDINRQKNLLIDNHMVECSNYLFIWFICLGIISVYFSIILIFDI